MKLDDFIHANRDAFEQDGPSAALWQRIADQLPDDHAPTNTPGLDMPAPDFSQHVPGDLRGHVPGEVAPDRPVNGKPFVSVHRSEGAAVRWSRWAVAATVSLLLLSGGFWWLNSRYGVTNQPEVMAISPSYAKEVTHYASLIDDKRDELRQLTESNPALYSAFSGDLESLEKSYQALKADLPQTPNQEVLIQAMIQNLQLQIDLLNEQLRVIQRIKQQSHEPITNPT